LTPATRAPATGSGGRSSGWSCRWRADRTIPAGQPPRRKRPACGWRAGKDIKKQSKKWKLLTHFPITKKPFFNHKNSLKNPKNAFHQPFPAVDSGFAEAFFSYSGIFYRQIGIKLNHKLSKQLLFFAL
jgi:hypothetical protein